MKVTLRQLRKIIKENLSEDLKGDAKVAVSNARFGYSHIPGLGGGSDIVKGYEIAKGLGPSGIQAKIKAVHSVFKPDESESQFGGLMIDHMEAEDSYITKAGDAVGFKGSSTGIGQITYIPLVKIAKDAKSDSILKGLKKFVKNDADKNLVEVYGDYLSMNQEERDADKGKQIISDLKKLIPKVSDDLNLAIAAAYLSIDVGSIEEYIGASSGIKPERKKRLKLFSAMYKKMYVTGGFESDFTDGLVDKGDTRSLEGYFLGSRRFK